MGVKNETIDYKALRVLDLTGLPSRRLRVRGTFAWVPDSKRADFAAPEFLLIREPNNRQDTKAVAIYSRQRKIGYVSTSTAASMSVVLDQLTSSDGIVVGGASSESNTGLVQFCVDVPAITALRKTVATNA